MKFRHELKYLINYKDYAVIKTRLDGLLKKDKNTNQEGFYHIRSLYFDDIFNKAYHEKYMGVMSRSKFRIRIYNGSDEFINLERKIKSNRYIYKQTAPLTKEQVHSILDNDYAFLLQSENELHRVFYFECTSNLMRPRVVVDYEREPYVLDTGRLRITFDKNVRAGLEGFDLFNPDMPMIEALDPGLLVLEVKYTELIPRLIREILPAKAADNCAVSKYILSCDKAAHKKISYY